MKPAAATLNGTVNPSGVPLEQCFFEYVEAAGKKPGTADPYAGGGVAPCEEPNAGEIGTGSVEVPVHARIAGLVAGDTYHYRLVAIDKNDINETSAGDGQDLVFGPPLIVGEASADVAAISATVQAEVEPQNLDTSFHVEYLTEAEYVADGQGFTGSNKPS